jgi:hypothetical protein
MLGERTICMNKVGYFIARMNMLGNAHRSNLDEATALANSLLGIYSIDRVWHHI